MPLHFAIEKISCTQKLSGRGVPKLAFFQRRWYMDTELFSGWSCGHHLVPLLTNKPLLLFNFGYVRYPSPDHEHLRHVSSLAWALSPKSVMMLAGGTMSWTFVTWSGASATIWEVQGKEALRYAYIIKVIDRTGPRGHINTHEWMGREALSDSLRKNRTSLTGWNY